MSKTKVVTFDDVFKISDTTRLVEMFAHAGYAVSAETAATLWQNYSRQRGLNWLNVGSVSDNDLANFLERVLT